MKVELGPGKKKLPALAQLFDIFASANIEIELYIDISP